VAAIKLKSDCPRLLIRLVAQNKLRIINFDLNSYPPKNAEFKKADNYLKPFTAIFIWPGAPFS
jgi:hypothetical protein